LDEAQEGFGAGDIGEVVLAVGGRELQSVTFCNRLASFLTKAVFEHFPVITGRLKIRLLRQDLNDVHDREKPHFRLLVVNTANLMAFKYDRQQFHKSSLILINTSALSASSAAISSMISYGVRWATSAPPLGFFTD
jgi:hypothetical protein